jgi:hypothetical protein
VATVSAPAPQPPSRAAILRRARIQAERELDRADADARAVIDTQLRLVETVFTTARQGLPQFADRALGLESQLALLRDYWPWSSGTNSTRYLQRAFHACVLDPEALEQTATRAVTATRNAFQEIDDALLVRLRQDLDNLPTIAPVQIIGQDRFLAAVTASIAAIGMRSRPELARVVAMEVASIAASELVTRLVLRSAAASGLVGAVAMSVPVSLGVGLAAGLVADQAVSWALDRTLDPRGTLIRLLDVQLTELQRRVLQGSAQAPGLRPRLEHLARDRAAARRTLIFESLGASTQETVP